MEHGDEQRNTRGEDQGRSASGQATQEPAQAHEAPAPPAAEQMTHKAATEEPPNGNAPPSSAGEPDASASAGADAGASLAPEPLAPGKRVEFFEIESLLSQTPDQRVYLAHERREDGTAGERVLLIERGPGAFADAEHVAALRLRHPRLLAPSMVLRPKGRELLVAGTLLADDGTPQPPASVTGMIDVVDALRAGAGLADALNYLHRAAVAHGSVGGETIIVLQSRAFLGGMEHARSVAGAEDAEQQYARDANALASALGLLAGIAGTEPEQEDITRENLRRIVAYGDAGAFTTAGELGAACGVALENAAHALPVPPPDELGTGRVAFAVGCATTVGLVRSQNQDACAATIFDLYDDQMAGTPFGVFVVADGMGGEAHGEVASRIAARVVPAELARAFTLPTVLAPAQLGPAPDEAQPEATLEQALVAAVDEANRRVREIVAAIGRPSGTTLTVVAARGADAVLAHIGDSRAYLLRGDVLAQLTEDHSVLARLQALDHPLLSDPDVFVPRSMLYRSLGQEDELGPDLLSLTLAPGDRLLICSDGLWDELDAQAIGQILAGGATPAETAQQLVAAANTSGGHDNSTAVVVFVRGVPEDEAAALPRRDDDDFEDEAGATPEPEPMPAPEEP
ncbi:MAG TPA: protein phosphatase 2C domain-containing protein [Ktedonobacterales bacterium]